MPASSGTFVAWNFDTGHLTDSKQLKQKRYESINFIRSCAYFDEHGRMCEPVGAERHCQYRQEVKS
ncbi:hypothetical protein GCM10023189_59940 [Nibrella saemangeumensis]|uniref:Uncharacterized protein n=1 Tax=Nibrella saemangeumensis TaxID=1084526 RepID=A0ABP8NPT2_9BACT